MYPAEFDYVRADSVQEAIELLNQHQDSKLLAGGHSLIPMLKLRLAQPATLIDIGRIPDMEGVSLKDDVVQVGALTTHAELTDSETLISLCPLLSEAASRVGDPQVRHRGTIGGNIAHADPASDLPAPLLALDATVHMVGKDGERSVAIGDFFVDLLTTALGEDEVITRITIPIGKDSSGSSYLKMEHPASGYAVCGAAALVSRSNDGSQVRLALNGVTATPCRGGAVEEALKGSDLTDVAIDAAVDDHLSISEPLSDNFASGSFRVHLAHVWSKRALKIARDRVSE